VDSEAAVADQDETLARVQKMFDSHGLRDGHGVDQPYVVSVLRDHVPAGWFGLVKELVEDLIRLGWDRRLLQVKEKHGSLRLYISQRDEVLVKRTIEARDRSETICQDCGKPGTLLEEDHWFSTLCEKCRGRRRVERART
jgi:hypothetical protein